MNMKFNHAVAAILLIAVLTGCENKTGDDSVKASAAATTEAPPTNPGSLPANIYAPGGTDGATVVIEPRGKAYISVVDGYPVRIYEGAKDGEYRQARLAPGDYMIHVGNIEGRQGLNLKFHGEAGNYYALALTYSVNGALFWTPVIVSSAPDGPVVADKDGLLIGKTQAEAVRLLTATSNRPGAAQQTDGKEEAEKRQAAEAKAKTLFQEALKAFEAGTVNEALQATDKALTIMPNFDSALVLRGVALARLKKPEAALDSLDKAIKIGRNARGVDNEWLHWPWLEKGRILAAAGKPDFAMKAFGESIRAKPTIKALVARANLSFTQGQLLGKKGDWGGAEPFFKSAQADAESGIELNPNAVKLWSIKTGAHIMLNEHEQACSAMRKTCDLGNCSILEQYPQCKPGGS